jgi:acyl-CoA reductase-like NAD-dependent aldehyde dehydrogenase
MSVELVSVEFDLQSPYVMNYLHIISFFYIMLPNVYGSISDKNSVHINMNKKLLSDVTIPAARTAQFLELNIKDLVVPMLETHASKQNFKYEWRMKNLRLLRKIITDHMEEWHNVLLEDLGKHTVEARITELNLALSEIDYFLNTLRSFMKPSQVSTMGYYLPCFSQVQDMPMRPPAILIISPSNYPVMLTLTAAAGALAAGNPVVLKPSEQTPNVSSLLQQLSTRYMDRGSMVVVEGGPEVVTSLLTEPWGKIVFTGSERVGRIVAEAASRTLTPVLLELGGKSPCYVDETAPSNLKLVAQRIVWGKTINGGQTVSDFFACNFLGFIISHTLIYTRDAFLLSFSCDENNSFQSYPSQNSI